MSAPSTATASERWPLIAIVIATALLMTACSAKSTPPLRPTLPPLPAQASQPCDLPAPLADGQVPTLIAALLDAWEGQAECEVRRRAAVEAYEAARAVNNGSR